jgi:aspartyl-tRNA(Asn)/glutamyl-tRNA(Gln) amidotransferase subunit A
MSELHQLGVVEIAETVRSRTASAIEIVDALLAQIERTEPAIQAWVMVDADRARAAAGKADELSARGEGGPLNGVPLGLKDIYDVEGLPTVCGSTFLPNTPKDRDAESVARLRRAGAVMMGKTVTTPFAMADAPVTRNPWNTERTPGGSSSGSAASVGARQVPAALGSQTAGSILRPAGYCGAVGLKPTFGRVSRQGIHPLSWSLDHAGPIARSVRDVAALLQIMGGYDPDDQGSRDRPMDDYLGATVSPSAPSIGLLRDVVELAQPEVRDSLLATAKALQAAGATVDEVSLPEQFDLMLAAQAVILMVEAGSIHTAMHDEFADSYPPRLRALVEIGPVTPAAGYLQAQRLRRRIRVNTLRLFERFDTLLMPTAANLAPEPSGTGDNRFQAIWSLVGFPTISIPSGIGSDHLPFATQLIARPWAESALLGAAAWAEQVLGPLPDPFA